MGWGIKDLLTRPFDPIHDAIDNATREILHSLGGVFDDVASAMDDVYNMVYSTNQGVLTAVKKGDVATIVAIIIIIVVAIFMPYILALLAELAAEFAFVAFSALGGYLSFGFLYALAYGTMIGILGGLLLAFVVPMSVWMYIAQASPWLSAILTVVGWIFPVLAVPCAIISAILSAAQIAAMLVFMAMGLPAQTTGLAPFDWQAQQLLINDLLTDLEAAGYTRSSAKEYYDHFASTGEWDASLLRGSVGAGQLVDDGGIKLGAPLAGVPSPNASSLGASSTYGVLALLLLGYAMT